MNTWFVSDTHWHHKNIIEYSKRPFSSVEEMDEAMIKNWNDRVQRGDMIYHLGDFAFARETEDVEKLLRRLNGQICLIRGNHDHKTTRKAKGFNEIVDYKEIKVGEQYIVLSHYAMVTWNRAHHGSWMLHGHSHGNLEKNPKAPRIDVGVDPMGYKPVSYDEISEMMKNYTYTPVDHHGRTENDDE